MVYSQFIIHFLHFRQTTNFYEILQLRFDQRSCSNGLHLHAEKFLITPSKFRKL